MLQVVAEGGNLLLYAADFLFYGLDVKLGNLADRLFYKAVDVFHHNVAADLITVFLHLCKDSLFLCIPSGERLVFQEMIDAFFEEDLLKGIVVPVVLKLVQTNLQLAAQELLGVVGAVFQHVVHA